ncbi:MAG: epoxyqueuosine reductase QueH [Eubacterium sp.]|nr:epoxyqueuosine reductase QueH [Eubacterium sp.]
MNKRNYHKELEQRIAHHVSLGEVPTLLLHSCCAPCSSYVLEYLSQYFKITVLYYNPNIYPEEEYRQRAKEQQRFIQEFPMKHRAEFIEGAYEKERFGQLAAGREHMPEGGSRCHACYEMRLREAAEHAVRLGLSYFTTTLSISPLKDADVLNEIGARLAEEYDVPYLYSDFKKKNGYLRSTQISKEYGMYRQDYCGCIYSMRERQRSSRPGYMNKSN